MLTNMMNEILQRHLLPEAELVWRELKGGTNSTVAAIGTTRMPDLYVVKSNTAEQIKQESRFYKRYQSISLLPKVKYVDPDFRFMIYDYLPGETSYRRESKQELMSELANQMMRHYTRPERGWPDEFEWVEEPGRVQEDIEYARSVIGPGISDADHRLVREIHSRRSMKLSQEDLYVLHGDFGVHNFLFTNDRLTGIIDPVPVVGRPLYDLLYAFCSSPDDLYLPILLRAVENMDIAYTLPGLIDDMLLALYSRMCTCLIHHPEDFSDYKRAWSEWIKCLAGTGE